MKRNKVMKKTGKKLLAFCLAMSMIVLAPGVKAEAVEHVGGCHTTTKRVQCDGPMRAVSGTTHTYYSAESGMAYCTIESYYGEHSVYCANEECNVLISVENRTCYKIHLNCGGNRETGFCKN